MGPNPYELAKYNKKLEKKKKMYKYLKAKMAQQEAVLKKQKEEETENSKLPTDIYQDSDGRIRDKEGNIINLNVWFFWRKIENASQHFEYQQK